METLELLQLAHNTYGLIIALKELLLGLDGSKTKDKELIGILALVNSIEERAYNIKVSLEESISIQQ